MEKFDDNRVTIYLRPGIKDIVDFVAKNDPVLSAGEKLNRSGAISKIILEWSKLNCANVASNGQA